MRLDQDLLTRFEAGLDPQRIERSTVPAVMIGYGEISAIFHINGDTGTAYKRMPLFSSRQAAQAYAELHDEYCRLLRQAGLDIPDSDTAVVAVPRRPVVLYIAQRTLPSDCFCHRLINTLPADRIGDLLRRIIAQQELIRKFNQTVRPHLEIAVDGQLSNWAIDGDIDTGRICFIDTSTPFIRRQGRQQLDTALLLRSVPFLVRRLTKLFLADGVLDRYFDHRQNLIDLVANLFKEQRPDLIPAAISLMNESLPEAIRPLTEKDVAAYYHQDRRIWDLFLVLRRIDRFMVTRIFRRRYEFILPGPIKR
ncbi:MAG: DUF6206 family protein [Thermodesulfobacteriota bacterium]